MRDREKRYLKAAKAVHKFLAIDDDNVADDWGQLSDRDKKTAMQFGQAAVDLWDALTWSRLDG